MGVAEPTDDLDLFKTEIEAMLRQEVRRHTRRAYVIGGAGVVGLGLAAYFGWKATQGGATYLQRSHYNAVALIFEIVRSAAAAALLAAAVWGVLNLARASLDQATRYEKRLVAGRFLVYVLNRFDTEIRTGQSIPLSEAMAVFKEWSANVETAFTNVRFGSKGNQDVRLSFSKDAAEVATGSGSKGSR